MHVKVNDPKDALLLFGREDEFNIETVLKLILDDGDITIEGLETSFLYDLLDKISTHLERIDKPLDYTPFRPPENGERNLEYYREKVGVFNVIPSNVGRTIAFTPEVDYPNNVKPIRELKLWLDSLHAEGVTYKFHNPQTSAYLVTVIPHYNIAELLKNTSRAYKNLMEERL